MSDEEFAVIHDALQLVCGAPFDDSEIQRVLKAEREAWKVAQTVQARARLEVGLPDAGRTDLARTP